MTTRAAQFVLALSPGIIPPAVNPCELPTCHALGPCRVRHHDLRGGQLNALVFEACVAKTFECASVCDVRSRGVCGCPMSIDENRRDFEVREKDARSATARS